MLCIYAAFTLLISSLFSHTSFSAVSFDSSVLILLLSDLQALAWSWYHYRLVFMAMTPACRRFLQSLTESQQRTNYDTIGPHVCGYAPEGRGPLGDFVVEDRVLNRAAKSRQFLISPVDELLVRCQ